MAKSTSKYMLILLYIISWIIFIGLCIEAGGAIVSSIFVLSSRPVEITYFYHQFDLSALYKYNKSYYFMETIHIAIVVLLKAALFYIIIHFIHRKKFEPAQPFSKPLQKFVQLQAFVSLGIGIFSLWGARDTELFSQYVTMPALDKLYLDGGDVWLFMCVILFLIAQLLKRGIEIQTENDLTI